MRDEISSSEATWQEEELSAAALPDKRLARRLRRLLDQLSAAPGKPIPAACGDWAGAKAAYRRRLGRRINRRRNCCAVLAI